MKRTTILSALVLLIGVGLFLSQRKVTTTAKEVEGMKSFVITSLETRGGAPATLTVRSVKASGEWKETRYDFGGGTTIRAATSEAQYSMTAGDKAKQWLSPYSLEMENHFRSAINLETHPNFVRREKVAGFDAYIHRGEFEEGAAIIEEALSPLLGLAPLRTVITVTGAPEFRSEALRVEFRDVSDAEVALADVPTEFTVAEAKAEGMRNSGLGDAADALLRSIKLNKGR